MKFFLYIIGVCYLAGSIPFGLFLTYCSGLGDIRSIGSGNIGATNVFRTGNKVLALLTFLCDALKGAVPCLIIQKTYGPDYAILGGLAAITGHVFPIWLKFRGGKGVATALGVLTVLFPLTGVTALMLWIICFKVGGISSIAGIIALLGGGMMLIGQWLMNSQPMSVALFGMIIPLLILWTHRENISRLINGEEKRV